MKELLKNIIMKNMQKVIYILLFVIILALATHLRFYKLPQSDFISVDEYLYYTGADIGITLKEFFFNFSDILRQGELGPYVSKLIKHLPKAARPGYNFLAAIATLIMGESKITAFYLSAFLGVLTVAATYPLARILFNSHRMALIAMLLISISSGHVLFSRMAHQISGAILLLVISFFFYVKSRKGVKKIKFFLALSALFYGLSFGVHPSIAYLFPVFILLELHRSLVYFLNNKNRNMISSLLRNLFLFFGIFSLAVIVWEIPRFLVHICFILRGQISPFSNYFTALVPINNIMSYLSELLAMWQQHSAFKPDFSSFFYFPSFLIDSQGKIYFAILIGSIVYLMIKLLRHIDDFRYLLLFAWIGAVYILYTAIHIYTDYHIGTKEIRVYILTLPALSIILALFFDSLFSAFKNHIIKKAAVVIALFLVICFGIGHSYEIINSQFSYTAMEDFLLANPSIDKVVLNVNAMGQGPNEKVFDGLKGFVIADTSFEYKGKIYLDKAGGRVAFLYRHPERVDTSPIFFDHQARTGVGWDHIKKLYKEGRVRYLLTSVFDYQWFRKCPFKTEPIFHYQSPFTCKTRVYDMSHGISSIETFYNDPYFRKIGIYDLKDIFEKE